LTKAIELMQAQRGVALADRSRDLVVDVPIVTAEQMREQVYPLSGLSKDHVSQEACMLDKTQSQPQSTQKI